MFLVFTTLYVCEDPLSLAISEILLVPMSTIKDSDDTFFILEFDVTLN